MTPSKLCVALALPWLIACGSELEGVAPDTRDTDSEVDAQPDTVGPADVDTVGPEDTDTVGPGDVDTVGPEDVDTADTDVFVPPPEWEQERLGDLGQIDALALGSGSLGFAASGARVLRWDGQGWLTYGEPGAGQRVMGVATDGVVVAAVGEGGLVAVRGVAGGEWQRLEGPAVDLYAAGLRGGRLFVAGDGGTVASVELGEDEPTFTTHFSTPISNLRALWVDPAGEGLAGVHAVGTSGQHIFSTGEGWRTLQVSAASVTLLDIVGLSNGDLVAVGDQHTVAVKFPSSPSWRAQVTNDDRRRDLAALALARDGTLRAFGAAGVVLRQTGTSWTLESGAALAAASKDLRVAAAVPGASSMMALAAAGGGVFFDGAAWKAVATGPESTLNALAGDEQTLWVVGNRGVLARRVEGVWDGVRTVTGVDLNGVAVDADGAAWVVGDAGTVLRVVDDVVTALEVVVPLDLFGVGVAGDRVWACGRGGALLEIDPETLSVVSRASGSTADLKALTVGGDGAVWIGGSFGTLLRMSEGLPVLVPSNVGGSVNDLAPTGDGVLAVGDNGIILRATAGAVTLEHEEPGRFLYAVATSPAARDAVALAVGAGGRILRQDGARWVAEVPAEGAATFEAVWIGASGEALVGGVLREHHLESRLVPLESAP